MERDSRGATAALHGCRSAVGADCAPADAWPSSRAGVSGLTSVAMARGRRRSPRSTRGAERPGRPTSPVGRRSAGGRGRLLRRRLRRPRLLHRLDPLRPPGRRLPRLPEVDALADDLAARAAVPQPSCAFLGGA
jgi:hypothetical protein